MPQETQMPVTVIASVPSVQTSAKRLEAALKVPARAIALAIIRSAEEPCLR